MSRVRGSRRHPTLRRLLPALLLPWGVLLTADEVAGQAGSPGTSQVALSGSPDALGPLIVPRIDGPIDLDGDPDKPVWASIEPHRGWVMIPTPGADPSERTEFRVAHDGRSLYFSCRAYDTHPEQIQASSLRRDERGWGSDRCAIFLDSMNDDENSLGFITTPAGVRSDFSYRLNGRPNIDWDAYWESAVAMTGDGWHAEIRIPFTSLLFQVAEDGSVTMGISMIRSIPRRNERIVHPSIDPRWGDLSHTRASDMRTLILHGVEKRTEVLISPYTLGGSTYRHAGVFGTDGFARTDEGVREVGLDVRYPLTSNLTLDLSVNTDFAQVEADEQQVNLSRFGLFFPEKRRFFQERGAIFEYALGGEERLFHSRQIGLANGQPVPIIGGARLVGRVGSWDIGALSMQTAESEALPSENLATLRLKRQLRNPNSYAGGILTSRIAADGGARNIVSGLDASFRILRYDDLVLNLAHALDESGAGTPTSSAGFLDSALLRALWTRPGQDGLLYTLGWTRSGSRFEPRMGFLQRRGFEKAEASIGYGWRLGPDSPFRTYGGGVDAAAFWRTEDRSLETLEITPNLQASTRNSHQFTLSLPIRSEHLLESTALPGGILIPAGDYDFVGIDLNYRAPQGSLVQAPVTANAGGFYGGWRAGFSVRPTWNFSRHLTLATGYGVDRVEFSARDERLTAHTGSLRAEVMFTGTTSALAFVQYNSAQDAVIANIRFNYRPREGNNLFLVWNEGLNTGDLALDGLRPIRDSGTLLIKYAHTLRLGF